MDNAGSKRWQKEHPDRWRVIHRQAQAKYKAKLKRERFARLLARAPGR